MAVVIVTQGWHVFADGCSGHNCPRGIEERIWRAMDPRSRMRPRSLLLDRLPRPSQPGIRVGACDGCDHGSGEYEIPTCECNAPEHGIVDKPTNTCRGTS
jgi:hypothetical protein